ncbi:biorientation of chromosomes in cell division protein 1-like 1 [Discoglossus pictus]
MANLPPGDPKLVSQIVNHLKSQGLFDQFRRDCLADVDTKPAYQNLRQRVDNFVSNHLANHTWSPHLNKNQLRNNIRQQVLKSGMLESGIDRIISQVVDPKINHTFRPQVEKVVQDFLSSLNNKEDPNANIAQNEERVDASTFITGSMPSFGPSTSVANDAMSILETISSLNQEATAARALTETSNTKHSDKVSKKTLTQLSVDPEKDRNAEETQEPEKPISDIPVEVTEPVIKQEDVHEPQPPAEEVKNVVSEANVTTNMPNESEDTSNESEEQKDKVAEIIGKKPETSEKTDKKEEKKETKIEKKTELAKKSDESIQVKEEKVAKESEPETVKTAATDKNINKHKTAAKESEPEPVKTAAIDKNINKHKTAAKESEPEPVKTAATDKNINKPKAAAKESEPEPVKTAATDKNINKHKTAAKENEPEPVKTAATDKNINKPKTAAKESEPEPVKTAAIDKNINKPKTAAKESEPEPVKTTATDKNINKPKAAAKESEPEPVKTAATDKNINKPKAAAKESEPEPVKTAATDKNINKHKTAAKESEPEPVKTAATDKNIHKPKAADIVIEDLMSVDSDIDAYTDVTVSSVHTSDLSSFEEESEEEAAVSDSTEEGEITSDDEEDERSVQSKAKSEGEPSEGKKKHTRHSYVHKPFLYSKYYSDSDDELTVEQRRQSIAKEKEERLLKRQVKREKIEEKRKNKSAEKSKTLKTASQGESSTDTRSSSKGSKSSRIKEVLKEQMFLEKKVAMSKKKKRDSRVDKNNVKLKTDFTDEDSRDWQKTNEAHEKSSSSSIKDAKHSNFARSDSKASKKDSIEEWKIDSRSEREHKKKSPLFPERLQDDHDTRDVRVKSFDMFANLEDQQKQKIGVKPDKYLKKESNDTETNSSKNNPKKEAKTHKPERERPLSEDRSTSRHRYTQKVTEDLDPQKSKRNSRDDDGLHRHSQRKSSSEERSDRKSKQKSEGRSSSYIKDDKSSTDNANKVDENGRKDSSKRERHQSTEKSRSEHKFKRSLSESRTHRDSQSTSRSHSTSQKRSKNYSEDKNEVDSANSDNNSKQDDNMHKDKRRSQSCSEERGSTKVKVKSNNKSSKSNEEEEIPEREKALVQGNAEKQRKSKSDEKDNDERNDTAIAQTSTKESNHKSRHSGDKGRERSKSDNRERVPSKSEKRLVGDDHKSSNSKHGHKDPKRKDDGGKLEEKMSKNTDEKRSQDRRNSFDRKSSKKPSSEYKSESSKFVAAKKISTLITENEDSAGKELVKPSTSSISTEEKDMSANNSKLPCDNATPEKMAIGEDRNENIEMMDTETINPEFESTNIDTHSTLKYKSKSVTSENILTPTVTQSTINTSASLTEDCKANNNIETLIENTETKTLNVPSSDSAKSDYTSSPMMNISKISYIPVVSNNQDRDIANIDFSQSHGDEQKAPTLESPDAVSSEITGSNDNEISTTDAAEEAAENLDQEASTTDSMQNVSMDVTELDNQVTGNDVEEVQTDYDATESDSKNIESDNISSFKAEEKCLETVTGTESEVESSVFESNARANSSIDVVFSEINTPHASSSSTVEDTNQKTDNENTATSSSSIVENAENVRVIFSTSSGENTATSSSIRMDKDSNENVNVSLDNSREYTATTSAGDVSNFAEDEADATILSDNSSENATTSSTSYRKNCFDDIYLDASLSSEKSRESTATSSQSAADIVSEDAEPMSNITLKAATSSTAVSAVVLDENNFTDRESAENLQENAATSSDNTEENACVLRVSENGIRHAATSSDNTIKSDGALRVYENVTTHAATSSSSVTDNRRELNLEGSLVSSELDNENSAASSSNVMDSSMGEDSCVWLKNPGERENENAASSSSTLTGSSRSDHNIVFGNVEESKNARATSSTQKDSSRNKESVDVKEYPANSSDIVMDSSSEASVSVSSGIDSGSAASCSSSGRDQNTEDEQDLDQVKERDNNTASSSSTLDTNMEDISQGSVVPSQNGSVEAASSSSSYMHSSTEHTLDKATLSSENADVAASSTIAMHTSNEQLDVASLTLPGNSNDNAATSSSNSTNHGTAEVSMSNINNSQATASSSVSMDSSTEEDMDMRFMVDIDSRANTATSSASSTSLGKEQLSGHVKDFGMTASSSTIMSSRTKEDLDNTVCPNNGIENAASSSDSSTKYNKSYDVLSNNNTACASTSSSASQRFTGDRMDKRNICIEINSEATAASSSNTIEFSSDNGGNNATSSSYLMASSLERENVSHVTYSDKNEAASSSGLLAIRRLQEIRNEELVGSQSADDATTSTSTETENEIFVSGRSADVEMSQNTRSSSSTVEVAVESSFAASGSDPAISGTSEESAVLVPGMRANDEVELEVIHSDVGSNNMNYERSDEKEDAVSSASSEEQKVCGNGSRQIMFGDGEVDGAVTSAGAEVSESDCSLNMEEAFGHVTCVNLEGIVDVSNIPVTCPVEDVAVSQNHAIDLNENRVTGANEDNQDTEESESGICIENINYETVAGIGAENEAETQVNNRVLEEGEGAVTSTGITEENEKVNRDIREGDSTCSGTENESGANVMTRPEILSANTEDDESAITSTGAKEDEEEGEGFVTSTGTASEDSSFSTGAEENSNSTGINPTEKIGLLAEAEKQEVEVDQITESEEITESDVIFTDPQGESENNMSPKSTEQHEHCQCDTLHSEECTAVMSHALSPKCKIASTNVYESFVVDAEQEEESKSCMDLEFNISENIPETCQDEQESKLPNTLEEREITSLEQDGIQVPSMASAESMDTFVSGSAMSLDVPPKEHLDNNKAKVDSHDDQIVDTVSNPQAVVDSGVMCTIYDSSTTSESSSLLSGLGNLSNIEVPAEKPCIEHNDTIISENLPSGFEAEKANELLEEETTVPVSDMSSTVEERLEEPNNERTENTEEGNSNESNIERTSGSVESLRATSVSNENNPDTVYSPFPPPEQTLEESNSEKIDDPKPKSPETEENHMEVLPEADATTALPNDEPKAAVSERDLLQEDSGTEHANEITSNSVESETSICDVLENNPDTVDISSDVGEKLEESNNREPEDLNKKPEVPEDKENPTVELLSEGVSSDVPLKDVLDAASSEKDVSQDESSNVCGVEITSNSEGSIKETSSTLEKKNPEDRPANSESQEMRTTDIKSKEEHKNEALKEESPSQQHEPDKTKDWLEKGAEQHPPGDSSSEIEKEESSEETAKCDSVKTKGLRGRKRLSKSKDEVTLIKEAEKDETPTALGQEKENVSSKEESVEEPRKQGQITESERPEQEIEIQSAEDTEEPSPVKVQKRRGRKSIAQLKEESSKKDEEKMKEPPPSRSKTVEESTPKVDEEKRKRGRPPKKRNLSTKTDNDSPVKKPSSENEGTTKVQSKAEETVSKNKDKAELEKTEKSHKKPDMEPAEKSTETVHRRGRKPKRMRSSSENENTEQAKKRKKSESGEEEDDDQEETEDEEEEDDLKGATTRAASRLEAQRKQPHKPTTRAAAKLSSPDASSYRDKRRKEKSTPDSKSNKTATARSKTPQASGVKRKREPSPPTVRTRGQQTSEEVAAKRAKRQ